MLIGTTENGFSIFRGDHMINFSQEKALLKQQVWAILEDQSKNIWFGTNNGITIYNPAEPAEKRFVSYNPGNSTISDQIRFLRKDRNNDIWIGTDNSGIYKYDFNKKVFLPSFTVNMLLQGHQDNGVTAMEIDKKNYLWVGTNDGLYSININTQESRRISTADGLAGNIINALYCSGDNTMYVGSKGKGITVIKGAETKTYAFDETESPQCFIEDQNHVIWIGTESHGVLGFKNGKIFKRYGLKEGLVSNLINFLNCDSSGNLYCGTNRGMNKIEVATGRIYLFTRRNGFVGIEAKKEATYTDSEGNLWFGTMNGAIRYSPWLDKPASLQPLTHIYRFTVNQVDQKITTGIRLKSSQNSIAFEYFSICLANPDAVQYQFMLEGIDKDWSAPTNQTAISYPALPPDNYTFKVRAKNAAGVWNTIPDFVSFRILPPFYQRWYFIFSVAISIIILLVVYIQLRERKLINEKNILEDKIVERTQEVLHMNEELAMKNKDVVSSIQYARHIQLSVLPSNIPFDNTFVLFKPKDIVSGDFFWFMEDDAYQWLAVVDCTGHGVPGAFMSLISYNSLNKIVREMQIKVPSDILNKLDEEITKTFQQHQKEVSISDGMDISLIRYNKFTHVLDYAGAFNPLWIIRKRELLETRADRFAIGRSPHVDKRFSNDITQLQPDDTIYLFTDGYADQFGGPDNKKYKTAKFKEFIINIQQYSMQKQKEMLEENIDRWRGNQIQVDDILVIGRKFKF
ncbi:MAG: SpoIIE family protein phosphatase [Bacteroidales bacterium]|nr:SpoIIE family protein phosphatase [Bacteroidales bacterium]